MSRPSRNDEMSKLHAKVDLLSKKIDILTTALTEQGVIKVPKTRKRPAAKKTTTSRAAPKKTAKSTTKSTTTAKKPAAKPRAKTKKRQG